MSDTGRDPYLAMAELLSRSASGGGLTIGKVQRIDPICVRADGLDLDGEALYVAQHLLPGWQETLTGLNWEVKSKLPEVYFSGECRVGEITGKCWVIRPQELVQGHTPATAAITHGRALAPGDFILLLRSEDGQHYFLVERMVSMDGYITPADPPSGGWPVEDSSKHTPDK